MLLSEPKLQSFLKNDVVPCWEMVRPVPKVTIDFGDGKKLERTLAGNTVIYVCSSDDQVADAFPGVYTADDFLPQAEAAAKTAMTPVSSWKSWHEGQVKLAIDQESRTTMSKAVVETPLVNALGMRPSIARAQQQNAPVASPMSDPAGAFERISARIVDSSHEALTEAQMHEMLRLPKGKVLTPEEIGDYAVRRDSQNNVRIVRPAVHFFLMSQKDAVTPEQAKPVLFKRLLKVALDDPYLGLANALPPGTHK